MYTASFCDPTVPQICSKSVLLPVCIIHSELVLLLLPPLHTLANWLVHTFIMLPPTQNVDSFQNGYQSLTMHGDAERMTFACVCMFLNCPGDQQPVFYM